MARRETFVSTPCIPEQCVSLDDSISHLVYPVCYPDLHWFWNRSESILIGLLFLIARLSEQTCNHIVRDQPMHDEVAKHGNSALDEFPGAKCGQVCGLKHSESSGSYASPFYKHGAYIHGGTRHKKEQCRKKMFIRVTCTQSYDPPRYGEHTYAHDMNIHTRTRDISRETILIFGNRFQVYHHTRSFELCHQATAQRSFLLGRLRRG